MQLRGAVVAEFRIAVTVFVLPDALVSLDTLRDPSCCGLYKAEPKVATVMVSKNLLYCR